MLIEFSVGNFRSLRDVVTLSMIATALDSKQDRLRIQNTIPVHKDLALLRSAVIYGANASGKSNLIKAFSFFRLFIMNSARESTADDLIRTEPFLLRDDTQHQPSHFEIVFLDDGIQYRYGFEATAERVTAEWLYYTPKSREATLFTREGDDIHIPSHSTFREGRGLMERTRANALFLSVAAQFNGKVALHVQKWIRKCPTLRASEDYGYRGYTIKCIEEGKYQSLMHQLMKDLDLDIEGLSVVETPLSPGIIHIVNQQLDKQEEGSVSIPTTTKRIRSQHIIRDKNGNVVRTEDFYVDEMESEGTQKIIALCGPLFDT